MTLSEKYRFWYLLLRIRLKEEAWRSRVTWEDGVSTHTGDHNITYFYSHVRGQLPTCVNTYQNVTYFEQSRDRIVNQCVYKRDHNMTHISMSRDMIEYQYMYKWLRRNLRLKPSCLYEIRLPNVLRVRKIFHAFLFLIQTNEKKFNDDESCTKLSKLGQYKKSCFLHSRHPVQNHHCPTYTNNVYLII